MALPIFPYIDVDDKRYQKIVIISDAPWIPRCHHQSLHDSLDVSSERSILTQTESATAPTSPTAPDSFSLSNFHLGRV